MTETDFYDIITKELKSKYSNQIERKPYWGSMIWLKIIFNGEEFRIKYRKRQTCVRLTIITKNEKISEIKNIGDYEINPKDKLLGKENTYNNKSIFKDININNSDSIESTVNWICDYIPLMYNIYNK